MPPCDRILSRDHRASVYSVYRKHETVTLLAATSPNVVRLPAFFHRGRLSTGAVAKSSLNIPPHFVRVATLPREIWMSERAMQYAAGMLAIDHKVVWRRV